MSFSTACPWTPRSRPLPSLLPRHPLHPQVRSSPHPPLPSLPATQPATAQSIWRMEAPPSAPSSTRSPAWNSATRAACLASRVYPRPSRTWPCPSCKGVGVRAPAPAAWRRQQQQQPSLVWEGLSAAPIQPPAHSWRQLSTWARRANWMIFSLEETIGIQVGVVDWWASPPEDGCTRMRRYLAQESHTLWRLVNFPFHSLSFSFFFNGKRLATSDGD